MSHVSEEAPTSLQRPSAGRSEATTSSDGRVDMSRLIWLTIAILCVWAVTTSNPVTTLCAVLLLPIIAKLVWRRGEPPLLVFVCTMQWLQASAAIFYANFYHASLVQAFGGVELEGATWLSLIGVLALAIGIRVAFIRAPAPQEDRHRSEALSYSISELFVAYAFVYVISYACAELAIRIPAVTQLLFAITNVKWTMAFMLLYSVSVQHRGYVFALAAVSVELLSGILGYFAGFKGVFFVLLIVSLTSAAALRGKRLLAICGVAVALLMTGLIWTAVKSDYREFLTQGLRSQEVLVPVEDRVGKLQDLLSDFRWDQLGEAAEALTLRMSYVQYFALTMVNVPSSMPYEHGALWAGALKHIATPRMFFPGKAAVDDSERASLYTGMTVAGLEQGTSIGIGYMAESYVDFGPVLMFLPILLLGVFYGLIYRVFVINSRCALLGCGIATAILVFGGNAIETSNVKLIGGNVTALLVLSAFYFTFGGPLRRWLGQSDR